MNEFLEWLKENKIGISGKYKAKRWGSVNKSEDGDWYIRICVQYDEYLDPVLSSETAAMQELVKMRTGHEGCGRCIDGKCAFTGFDLVNPTEEQIELAKRLIKFRINAIKDGRIPKCSYIGTTPQPQTARNTSNLGRNMVEQVQGNCGKAWKKLALMGGGADV